MGQNRTVVVVGAGIAGLSAALAARQLGADVLVLEAAAEAERGGNTFFSGGVFRFPFRDLDDIRALATAISDSDATHVDVGSYPAVAMSADLISISESRADGALVERVVDLAYSTMTWLRDTVGVQLELLYGSQSTLAGTKHVFWGGTITQVIGGGKALSDQLFAAARRTGVTIEYDTRAQSLQLDSGGSVESVGVKTPAGITQVGAGAVVLCAGGFEANEEMRARYLGPGWELARVRGTRQNQGDGIRMGLEAGARAHGHWSGVHAVAWDRNAPAMGDRVVRNRYQRHSYPLGLLVNLNGERFLDEGAGMHTYARCGHEIMKQPRGIAFQIFDQRTAPLLREEYWIESAASAQADTLEELATELGIECGGLTDTVASFNAACKPGRFDITSPDGLAMHGLEIRKSNWAQPLDSPPFIGFAVTCGVTQTFGGVSVDAATGQVLDVNSRPIEGLFAAGELVGGLFYHNYLAGSGLTSAAVLGRVAGEAAAASLR